jgi:hypothetical protein
MTFKSLPLVPREIKATEAVLERLYAAARLGMKGETLATRANLLPIELNRLRQMDPIADMAILKGYADAEAEMANTLYEAGRGGDVKAALEVLKHRHDWVAKQQIQVDTAQAISITLALEQANARVSASQMVEEVPQAKVTRQHPNVMELTDAAATVHR